MTGVPEFLTERAPASPFDPAPTLRPDHEAGPLRRVRLWDGSTPWLVTSHVHQRALLADPRVSTRIDSPGFPNFVEGFSDAGLSFLMMDDPEHNRLRRMVISPFTVRRVESMRARVREIVDEALTTMLAGQKPADLVEGFALPVPSLVICELLGVPYVDHDFFQSNSRTFIHRESSTEQRESAITALAGYLDDLIGERIAKPGEDLLSGLAKRVSSAELTRTEAAEIGVLMLIGGHETTANMIALGTLALLLDPEQLALLRDPEHPDDSTVVASAVEELLRYLSIVHNGRRRAAVADIEIAGRTIRAGEGIILVHEVGNRDPEVFADPERLDLRRDAHGHLAFGFGVHQCIGQPLARLELQVVFATLFRRIPTLALATELDRIPFKHDGFIYGVYELPVTW